MGLKDSTIKKSYDSDIDDILLDFYNPVLEQSIRYKRLVGFFSSSSLAAAAKGISKFIENGGTMQLISCPRFQEKDIEVLRNLYDNSEILAEKIMLYELQGIETLEDEFIKDHVRAFGWMVSNGLLEIKVALVRDDSNVIASENQVSKRGIFHQKVGILEDTEGGKISFSGSDNESLTAWKNNIEEFKVFRNWIPLENEYFLSDEEKFDKFWNGRSRRADIISLPEAVKSRLIELAPDEITELNLEKYSGKPKKRKTITLRPYQEDAIQNWENNDYKGIFEMATGTGKTFAALGCLSTLYKNLKSLITVIACPMNHLVSQWEREVEVFGLLNNYIIADSTNVDWKNKTANKILDIDLGIEDRLIILTTHTTSSSEVFKQLISRTKKPTFLIIDEVHGIGSKKNRNALLNDYDYRLGLSATPERWLDPEGTAYIKSFFSKTVYEYPLEKAIGPFLVGYEYYPHFISLTGEEIEKYKRETEKIVHAYYNSKRKEQNEYYNLLCIKRQEIVKNAINKYSVLSKILDENAGLKHGLVYCSPQQIKIVQKTLNEKRIRQHKFTEKENPRSQKKYGGISERDFLIHNFAQGELEVLVAIKCLDEGVDIPPAKFAVMMSNSGNPREYIQRRGRILRKSEGKEKSIIHDIIVVPSIDKSYDSDLYKLEKKIFKREIRRYKEFANIAENSVQCVIALEKIAERYGIYEV